MKNWYNSLFLLGINKTKLSNADIKRIKLFNAFCYCWYVTAFILILNYFSKTPIRYPNILAHIVQSSIIVIAQLLHSRGKFDIGRFMFALMLVVNSFLFGNYLRTGQLLEFYMILPPAVSLVLSDNKIINYSILILSLLGFTLPNHFLNHYPTIHFYSPALLCLFFLYYFLINYFKKQNNKIEKLLELERDKVIADKVILEEQKNKLDQLNQYKSHFFVNFSHEIRTPLTIIQGNASRIDLENPMANNQEKIDLINSQVAQIQNIIDSIIDLSKMDANAFKLNTGKVALQPFLQKHFTDFKEVFHKKEIQFDLEINVPELAVCMDEALMSKSINNLLSNALKFTPKKGKVTIDVYLDEELIIAISDNGIGIPKQDINHVFDRFFQSDNTINKSQGSGIGLSFTKSIIVAHQFRIFLQSIPLEKTTFYIAIPHKAIDFTALPQDNIIYKNEVLSHSKELPKIVTSKRNILIVEDNEAMRNYLQQVLNSYQITAVENGLEALEILQHKSFDIIITDFMMPLMDGADFVQKIKEQKIKTPIIVLTARSDQEGKLQMLRLGIDGYLNKPFIEEELHLMIQKSLQSLDTMQTFESTLEVDEKEIYAEYAYKFNKELQELIFEKIHSPYFCVEDIATHLNISKSTLNRKTKAILGQTTQELIMEARFQKARKMLKENPYATKKEIAESIGITNATYFFGKLKERFGNIR